MFTAACFMRSTPGASRSASGFRSPTRAAGARYQCTCGSGSGAMETTASVHITASGARITESKRLGAEAANLTKSRAPGRPQPPPSSSSLPFLFLQPPLATNAILQSPNHVDTLTAAPMIDLNYCTSAPEGCSSCTVVS